jgi:hypothetical protein
MARQLPVIITVAQTNGNLQLLQASEFATQKIH